jgi:TIR domain
LQIRKSKIFISHAWEDKTIVRRLEAELKAAGAETWVDHSGVRGGDNLPERISEALAWCDTVMLIWSEAASQSHWVKLEWTNALALRKTIIPCLVSQAPLPALLANVLYVDCRDFEQGFAQLRQALHLDQFAKPIPTSAIKERRIDAAVPSAAEVNRPIDLRVQVRFPDSPRLGLEDWPAKNKPAQLEQAAENVALEFPIDAATGKLGPARLEIRVVAPDFDIASQARQLLLVPPEALSKCLSFLITPKRTGVCRLNVEVYNVEHIFLGAIPTETEVGGEVKSPTPNVANLFLFVTVGQEKTATRSGETYSKPKMVQPPTPATSQTTIINGDHTEAGQDIITTQPAKRTNFRKGLALSVVAFAILVTFIIFQKLELNQVTALSEGATYYGVVLDENENGVGNATIEIKVASDSTRLVGSGQSLPNGEFSILAKVEPGSTVWVKISKAGYKDFTGMKSLNGNDKVILSKLRREP